MSEFTKGPLKIRRVNRWFEVEDSQEREIASVWKDDRIKDAEAMANANLIAAAPDIYEALEMVISYLGLPEEFQEGEEILYWKVTNSLKKAKGEPHE